MNKNQSRFNFFSNIKYDYQEYSEEKTEDDFAHIEIEYKIKKIYEEKYKTYEIKMSNKLKLLEQFQKKEKIDKIEEKKLQKIKNQIENDFIKLYKQQKHINELKQKLLLLLKIKTEELKKFKCPICFDRDCNIVLIPCGHIVCKICYDFTNSSFCSICRSSIEKYNKIYFN
jgi:hypothetical protein